MRHRILVALLLSLAVFPALGRGQEAGSSAPANAAIKYAQAFALLPGLDKDQEKLLEQWDKVPLNAAAVKLIDRSANSRVYLHRGAKLPRCDWGLDYEDGIRLLVPHGPRARTLARLTALHARHEFEQGHWKAGADDVTALLKLARHLETDPIMILQLVGFSIERIAIEAAAPYLPELKPVVSEVVSAVEALPAGPTLRQMMLTEKQVGGMWFLQELKKVEQHKPGAWQAVWKEVLSVPEEGGAANRDLVKSAKTFEEAVKLVEDLLPLYDQLAKIAALPWKEMDAQYPEFAKKAKAANPLADFFLPNIAISHAMRRTQTQLALLKAAFAVVQGGPDKLKDIKDPFGDGPFEYKALDKGFELKSKLISRDQPVTLAVGQAKK